VTCGLQFLPNGRTSVSFTGTFTSIGACIDQYNQGGTDFVAWNRVTGLCTGYSSNGTPPGGSNDDPNYDSAKDLNG
jgi:hypothetical protein